MRTRHSFPEYAERVLIAGMLAGIVLIAQRYSLAVFKFGLIVLVISTLLQIAIGNLPKQASVGRSLVLVAGILAIVAAVFSLGILLVPLLSQLGR